MFHGYKISEEYLYPRQILNQFQIIIIYSPPDSKENFIFITPHTIFLSKLPKSFILKMIYWYLPHSAYRIKTKMNTMFDIFLINKNHTVNIFDIHCWKQANILSKNKTSYQTIVKGQQ